MVQSYTKRTLPTPRIRERRDSRRLDTGRVAYDRHWREQTDAFVRMYPFCIVCLCEGKLNDCIRDSQDTRRKLIVDHITPHNGNADLFWDQDNWQTLGKWHHDRTKAHIEHAHKDWWTYLRTIIKEKQSKAFIEQNKRWIPDHVYKLLSL